MIGPGGSQVQCIADGCDRPCVELCADHVSVMPRRLEAHEPNNAATWLAAILEGRVAMQDLTAYGHGVLSAVPDEDYKGQVNVVTCCGTQLRITVERV